MGFLTGNFQNLMLTRLVNQQQRKLTSIMSRLRSAKRQAERVEKQISSNLRTAQNSIRAQGQQMMQQAQFAAQEQAYASIFGQQAGGAMAYANNLMNTNPDAFMAAMTAKGSIFSSVMNQGQSSATNVQTWMQSQLAMVEQEAETMKEMQLEPLKDLESDLEVEKESTETNIKLYQQWKEAAKEDVQASAKNLKPNYGGNS